MSSEPPPPPWPGNPPHPIPTANCPPGFPDNNTHSIAPPAPPPPSPPHFERHPRFGQPCENFAKGLPCRDGVNCPFLHAKDETVDAKGASSSQQPAVMPVRPRNVVPLVTVPSADRKMLPCRWWKTTGRCFSGDLCPFSHAEELRGIEMPPPPPVAPVAPIVANDTDAPPPPYSDDMALTANTADGSSSMGSPLDIGGGGGIASGDINQPADTYAQQQVPVPGWQAQGDASMADKMLECDTPAHIACLTKCEYFPFTRSSPAPAFEPSTNAAASQRTKTPVTQVIENDCVDVALELISRKDESQRRKKVGILNFANCRHCGGGFERVKGGQEEYLFRRTSLGASLWPHRKKHDERWLKGSIEFPAPHPSRCYYPWSECGGILSPHVEVIANKTANGGFDFIPQTERGVSTVAMDVHGNVTDAKLCMLSIAAQDLRPGKGDSTIFDIHLTAEKFRTMFHMAAQAGCDALVLGPIGCGAFENPPEAICQCFWELLHKPSSEFAQAFDEVVYACLGKTNVANFDRYIGSVATCEPLQPIEFCPLIPKYQPYAMHMYGQGTEIPSAAPGAGLMSGPPGFEDGSPPAPHAGYYGAPAEPSSHGSQQHRPRHVHTPCKNWARYNCTEGNRCDYSHTAVGGVRGSKPNPNTYGPGNYQNVPYIAPHGYGANTNDNHAPPQNPANATYNPAPNNTSGGYDANATYGTNPVAAAASNTPAMGTAVGASNSNPTYANALAPSSPSTPQVNVQLPPGWSMTWSAQHNRFYFVNPAQQSVWTLEGCPNGEALQNEIIRQVAMQQQGRSNFSV